MRDGRSAHDWAGGCASRWYVVLLATGSVRALVLAARFGGLKAGATRNPLPNRSHTVLSAALAPGLVDHVPQGADQVVEVVENGLDVGAGSGVGAGANSKSS